MNRYGKTISSHNEFQVVEILREAPDGTEIQTGYAVLGPDGSEFGAFAELREARALFERLAMSGRAT